MGLPDPVKLSQIRQLAEAVVKDNFLELFDLGTRSQGGKTVLSVVLDKPNGQVGLQECEAVSRELESRLDELDVMEGSYLLEVSSPGMDRPFATAAITKGSRADWPDSTLIQPLEGLVSFDGRLNGIDQKRVLVRIGKERTLWVPLAP